MRGSLAWEGDTTPKFAEPSVVFGEPNHGVLVRLNDSARNCIRTRSVIGNILNTLKSTSGGRSVRMFGNRVLSVRSA